MTSRQPTESVEFLTVEEGGDLIVAFAITRQEPGDINSLILLRTPKYESLLPDDERGVSVSHESFPEVEDERLRRISLGREVVEIDSTRRRYTLDVSRVEAEELDLARQVLERMNFDNRFTLEVL